MILSCEIIVPEVVNIKSEICLLAGGAKMHKEHVNGSVPVSVWSFETGVEGVAEAVIKSCMRQHSPERKSTPWEKVVQRLRDYNLGHIAYLNPDPLHIDIKIFQATPVVA